MANININGCAAYKIVHKYTIKFALGSKVYIKKKAMRGSLEPVVVKKTNRVFYDSVVKSGVQPEINYVDTLNRIWLERELIWQEEAVTLAETYWRAARELGKEKLKCNRNFPNCN